MEVVHASYGLIAEGNDYIAFTQAGFACGAAGLGGEDDDSGFFGEIVETHNAAVQGERLRFDSDKSPAGGGLLEYAGGYRLVGVDAGGVGKSPGRLGCGGVVAPKVCTRG